MKRFVFYGCYALAAYVIGMGSLVYLVGFLAGAPLPKTVDAGLAPSLPSALAGNLVMLVAFLVPHSIMARPRFKAAWTRIVPAALERATYILVAGVSLLLLMWAWQPMPSVIWQLDSAPARALAYLGYGLGWVTIVLATFNIDHFQFFGLRQVWDALRRRPRRTASFTAAWLYGLVRHPISLGWLFVFWSTPRMTVGHLVLAAGMSIYIAIVTPIEEADLIAELGDDYVGYRARVRAFLPWRRSTAPRTAARPG
ncbi:MAG: isoprenylcysteine carboxylmethyltransferase family protein [Deltaproteobacteria bacterium]|nr:isoprenylcysteine carboxylmethyltransferase family protein [Kofleriaceae bacterium]